MSQARRILVLGSVAALVALALLVVARGVRGAPWRTQPAVAAQGEIERLDADLRGASAALAGHGRVLYASSVPNERLKSLGFEDQNRRFFIAQYALAPRVIVLRGDAGRVIGDFPDAAGLDGFARQRGYRVLWRRGGLGVMGHAQ